MQPFRDFIMGTKEMTFCELTSFAKYVQINENQEIQLFVYNIDTETVRGIPLTPRGNWGGQGLLGADISFGYLNKLPLRKRDIKNQQKSDSMKNVFGGLSSNKRVPTQEGLSSDENEELKNDNTESQEQA